MKVLRICIIFLFTIFFMSHCVMRIGRLSSNPVISNNNYIIFKLPKEYLILNETLEIDSFKIEVLYQDDQSIFKNYKLLNPNKNVSAFDQIIGVEKNLLFMPGCEYRFPVPAGEHIFNFGATLFIKNYSKLDQFGNYKIQKFNLPANESIRLNIEINRFDHDKLELIEKAIFNQKNIKNSLQGKKLIEITATVEQNPEPDIDKPCEIPETQ